MPTPDTGTTRANVARTMVTSLLRAGLPPLVAVVTLPIILGRISLDEYGLWATITGLIAVLAAVDAGMATFTTRRVAEARGADDAQSVVVATRESVSVLGRLALIVMPLTALAGWPIMGLIAPADDVALGIWIWLGVVVYQTVGWYYSVQSAVATGLQRGDLANAVNAVGALVGAAVTVAAVLAGWGLFGMLLGLWALGAVTLAGHLRNAVRLTQTRAVWLPRRATDERALLLGGLALASMQVSLLVEPAAAKALLAAFDGTESAAAMQLGFTVTRMALVAAMAPTAAILVGVAEWRGSQPERIAALVRNASYASLALVAVLATVMLATGPYVAQAWLGISVPGIGVAIRGLSVVAIMTITVWLFTQALLGHGNTRTVTVRLAVGASVALLGMILGAPMFGLAGVIAASFVGAWVSALLLSSVDREYTRIVWGAFVRMGPPMVALGVVGAFAVDAVDPQSRLAALGSAVVAGLVAAGVAWGLMPGATRALMVSTVGSRLRR